MKQCDKCYHTRIQKRYERPFILDVEGQKMLSKGSHLESGPWRMNEKKTEYGGECHRGKGKIRSSSSDKTDRCNFQRWKDFKYDWTIEPGERVLRMRSGEMNRNLLMKKLANQGRNPGFIQRTIWSCYGV